MALLAAGQMGMSDFWDSQASLTTKFSCPATQVIKVDV